MPGGGFLKATTTTIVLGTLGFLIGAFYGASLLVTGVEGVIAFAALGGVVGLAAGFETERKKLYKRAPENKVDIGRLFPF